ncbi:MAG: efflux RND transporter permease subunit [Bacteroidales bacterium]
MTSDGKGEAVGGITLMLKGGNASRIIEEVKARVELVNNNLPEGITIKPYLDRSVLVKKVIHTVAKNPREGGLIVIFVLLLMLGDWRARTDCRLGNTPGHVVCIFPDEHLRDYCNGNVARGNRLRAYRRCHGNYRGGIDTPG